MNNAERLIELYKVLEDELEKKYRREGKPYTNTVYQFICDKESEPFREKLDLCRQVRNLLTHSASIEGEAPVEPCEALLSALQDVISYLRKPPLAIERATPAERLFRANPDDRISWLVKRMEERGFSHVPVMNENRLIGVFSVSTVFTLLMSGDYRRFHENTRIRDIYDEIAPDAHFNEKFLFSPPDTTADRAQALFSARASAKDKRVAAIFITQDGTRDSRLLGMLTPWDLMGAERSGR